MEFTKDFNGSNVPYISKHQIGEAMATAGVPVEVATLANVDGLLLAETTSCADCVGVTMDAQATRNTAQQADGSDPAVMVSVVNNPHGIFRANLSGGAASGTAITENSNTVLSTDGLLTTLALAAGYDDGIIWGYDGANMGHMRKITAVAGTNETLIIAMPNDIAVGDTFLAATFGPAWLAGMTLTTELDEVRADDDGQAVDNFRCVSMQLFDKGGEGSTKSTCRISIFDHLFASGGSV